MVFIAALALRSQILARKRKQTGHSLNCTSLSNWFDYLISSARVTYSDNLRLQQIQPRLVAKAIG